MKAKCKLCGYEWTPRTPSPVMCPHCHSYKWNGDEIPHLEIKKSCRCFRCGYEWTPRKKSGKPSLCPACLSKLWDTPRKLKLPEHRVAIKRAEPHKFKYPYRPSP